MAVGQFHFFAKNASKFKMDDLTADLFMSLHLGTWVPDITATGNSIFADATNELGTANGYTANGFNLTGEAVAADAANNGFKISTNAASWTASGAGITARRAVLYVRNTLWTLVNPLIGYFNLDSTDIDVVTAAGNILQLNCPADGWGIIFSS